MVHLPVLKSRYSAPLYVDMEKRVLHGYEDENGETIFRAEGDGLAERADKVWIGKVSCKQYFLCHSNDILLGSNHASVWFLYSQGPRVQRPL